MRMDTLTGYILICVIWLIPVVNSFCCHLSRNFIRPDKTQFKFSSYFLGYSLFSGLGGMDFGHGKRRLKGRITENRRRLFLHRR